MFDLLLSYENAEVRATENNEFRTSFFFLVGQPNHVEPVEGTLYLSINILYNGTMTYLYILLCVNKNNTVLDKNKKKNES